VRSPATYGVVSLVRVAAALLALSAVELGSAAQACADSGFSLAEPPLWAVGLEGYGGLLLQLTSADAHVQASANRAHGFGGGQLRGRYRFFQGGFFLETTDSGEASRMLEPTQEHFRTFGAFAGAWLPFEHWVDVDASLGIGSRLYRNPSPLYGPDGLSVNSPAITFRLGVSDRSSESLLGARLGAAFVGSVDLDRHAVTWHRRYLRADGTPAERMGTTPIGGVAFGLMLTAGFDVCACSGKSAR
jgi:hypothetical protein